MPCSFSTRAGSRAGASTRTAPADQPCPPSPCHAQRAAVSRADLLRGYEIEPDRYVAFDPGELKELRRKTSTTMEIVRSVKLAEIDPVFFETSYYVVPDRGGEKAYAILFRALQETGHVALARVGMYGREHVIIVRPAITGCWRTRCSMWMRSGRRASSGRM
jgi:Ku protein